MPRSRTQPLRVALIGGTGLIGRAVVQALTERGVETTVVSRRPPDAKDAWYAADIGDRDALGGVLRSVRPDVVVHLAALLQHASERDPQEAVRINVDGTVNVLECCRELGVRRLVFGSSIAVYGERSDLMREDDAPSANVGLYGVAKRLGELLGERYAALYGLDFVALRYSGVFGPGAAGSSGMALVRERIMATAHGTDAQVDGASGDERAHLTHVSDAASATCLAVLHPDPLNRVYNVCGPQANYMSLREFHAAVRELAPAAGRVHWSGSSRSAGPVDATRLKNELGYIPAVSVPAGLAMDLFRGRD